MFLLLRHDPDKPLKKVKKVDFETHLLPKEKHTLHRDTFWKEMWQKDGKGRNHSSSCHGAILGIPSVCTNTQKK